MYGQTMVWVNYRKGDIIGTVMDKVVWIKYVQITDVIHKYKVW